MATKAAPQTTTTTIMPDPALLDEVIAKTKQVEYEAFGSRLPIKLTIGQVRRFLSARTKSGAQPSDEDIVKFMMLCKSRSLNPWEGEAFLVGYDGKEGPVFSLITAHLAFLRRADANPDFDGMESGVILRIGEELVEREGDFFLRGACDQDGNPVGNGKDAETLLGGWARVYHKSRKVPTYRRLNLSGYVKPTNIWRTNPSGMVVKCAEADALRSAFPTMLGGLYLQEELTEAPNAIPDRKPVEMPRAIDEPAPAAEPVAAATNGDLTAGLNFE